MNRSTSLPAITGGMLGLLLLPAMAAASQDFAIVGMAPTLDRWMYPFSDFSGTRTTAPTYTTLHSGYDIFDDRDAEYLIGFNTGTQIPTGFAPFQYRIASATVTTTVLVSDASATFVYDPTPDAVSSYFDPGDPSAEPPRAADPARTDDLDAGRPVDLFAVAYRGGFTAATWAENSPFGPPSPAPRTRNAYPVDFGGTGGAQRDVSNNVTDRFDPAPLATAAAFTAGGEAMAAGEPVADGAQLRFSVNVADVGNVAYLRGALAGGRLNVLATSLHAAVAFGAGPVTYPVFKTREHPLPGNSALSLSVTLCLADIGATGGVFGADYALDNNDFVVFIDRFFAADMGIADIGSTGGVFGRDGQLDNNDFVVFIDSFFSGCGNG